MRFREMQDNISAKFTALGTILSLIAIRSNVCFGANSGIGTAEVQTATDNIKRVITSIAMPLRWCINFC